MIPVTVLEKKLKIMMLHAALIMSVFCILNSIDYFIDFIFAEEVGRW